MADVTPRVPTPSVCIPRDNAIAALSCRRKVAIGVTHARPLPGAPRCEAMQVEAI